MYIAIIGSDGVGKARIANFLVEKMKFKWLQEDIDIPKDPISREFFHLNQRANLQVAAKKHDSDVVTVRTAFDTFDVFAELSNRMDDITNEETQILWSLKTIFTQLLPIPEAIIYVTSTKIQQITMMKERGIQVSDDYLKWQDELYKKFVDEISIPVVEIDSARNKDLYREIEFSINSLKTSRVSTRTIWTKDFYK